MVGSSNDDPSVTVNKADTGVIANITGSGVNIETQQANKWSDLGDDLAFIGGTGQMELTAFQSLDTGSTVNGKKTITFNYSDKGVISSITIG